MQIERAKLQTVAVGALMAVAATTFICGFVLLVERGIEAALTTWACAMSLAVLLLPVMSRRRYDLFEPLSFVILAVLVGTTLKAPYLFWAVGQEPWENLLQGHAPEFFLPAAAFVFVGMSFFAAGYSMKPPVLAVQRFKVIRRTHWHQSRLFIVAVLLMCISLASTIQFVKGLGVNILSPGAIDLSSKRFIAIEGSDYAGALGYYRWGASLSLLAFVLLYVRLLHAPRALGFTQLTLLVAGALISIAFAVFTSSRTSAGIVLLVMMIITYYYSDRIQLHRVAGAAVAGIVLLVAITLLRPADSIRTQQESSAWQALTEVTVGGRHFMDLTKTGLVIDAVPDRLPYTYGATLGAWVVAPVPRAWWPEKPALGLGKLVGDEVFSLDRAGVPPGFVGEMYMNFSIFGVTLGMFAAGAFMRFFYQGFKPQLVARNPNAILLYAMIVLPCSYGLMNSDFSKTFITLLRDLIPVIITLRVIQSKRVVLRSPAGALLPTASRQSGTG